MGEGPLDELVEIALAGGDLEPKVEQHAVGADESEADARWRTDRPLLYADDEASAANTTWGAGSIVTADMLPAGCGTPTGGRCRAGGARRGRGRAS